MALSADASRVGGAGGAGSVLGAKAERLARALDAGLPVLPGWVVPVTEGEHAIAAGLAAARQDGMAAGRRAVLAAPIDPLLVAELRRAVVRLGGRVVVRPSSPLGGDPRWAGAFTAARGVTADGIGDAVRMCWASAFSPRTLERLALCGQRLESLALAVLLQPDIEPTGGGLARMSMAGSGPVGEVTVEGMHGHPAPLLSGWATGASARIPLLARSGTRVPSGAGPLARLIGRNAIAAVARLASAVHHELGDDTIEWANVGEAIHLLQSRCSAPGMGGSARPHLSRLSIPPRQARTAAAFARLLDGLPPAIAEKYVLPWAGGTPKIDRLCQAVMSASADEPASGAESLPGLYREAMHQAWGNGTGPGGHMLQEAAHRAVTGLTGESAADSLSLLATAHPVDPDLATRLLQVLARANHRAAAHSGGQAAHRWLPFLASTVRSCGGHVPARPAIPGVAVGRLVLCGPDGRVSSRPDGAILLVDRPLPAQAPLLLAANGVIAREVVLDGRHPASPGRRVPAVTGCHPETVTGQRAIDGSWLAAIDGATGEVALLRR